MKTGQILSTGSSITEGIGIMRITENFKHAKIDDAVQCNDQEMISMLYHLARNEGLLVGTSAALNVFAAYKYALENRNSGQVIVTVLCDSALRYQSKVFNPEFLKKNVIVDLSKLVEVKHTEILLFLNAAISHMKNNTSLVIITHHIDTDRLPEEIVTAPTLIEALDIIELDEISRDLGF